MAGKRRALLIGASNFTHSQRFRLEVNGKLARVFTRRTAQERPKWRPRLQFTEAVG